jgi:hypothetical protein
METNHKNPEPAPAGKKELELAKRMGYTQGVCEAVIAIDHERAIGKKLLSKMNVTKEMAQKYAKPETFATMEQGIFSQKAEQKLEQKHSRSL